MHYVGPIGIFMLFQDSNFFIVPKSLQGGGIDSRHSIEGSYSEHCKLFH
jgi:hypothetical protein